MAYKLFIDLETTGDLSHGDYDIIEIACILYNDKNQIIDKLYQKLSPNKHTRYKNDINKLKAAKYSKSKYPSSDEFIDEFTAWLDLHLKGNKTYLIAYNASWDEGHLKKWFIKNQKSMKKYFYDPAICVMSICAVIKEKWLSLSWAAKSLNIPYTEDRLHTADYDVMLCKRIYDELKKRLNNGR